MEKIDFAYLNSLDFRHFFNDKNKLVFKAENDEFYFYLIHDKKNYLCLNLVDKRTNTDVYYYHQKLVDLWNNLLKEIDNLEEKILERIDL